MLEHNYTLNLNEVKREARDTRRLHPGTVTCIGGSFRCHEGSGSTPSYQLSGISMGFLLRTKYSLRFSIQLITRYKIQDGKRPSLSRTSTMCTEREMLMRDLFPEQAAHDCFRWSSAASASLAEPCGVNSRPRRLWICCLRNLLNTILFGR